MRVVCYLVRLSTDRRQFGPSLAIAWLLAAWFTYQLVRHGTFWWDFTWASLGWVSYSLAEYAYHRWAAHEWLLDVSEAHHTFPDNYFAAPWLLVAPTAWTIYLSTGTAFTAGVCLAHLWQEIAHYLFHHTHLNWKLRHAHMYHHANWDVNFGHSTTLWDRVFKTFWRT